jgi:sulfur relay protein TusB/DsrH
VKVLHIIRSHDDRLARRIIADMARTPDTEQTLVMIQDGVYNAPTDSRAFACSDDVRARGIDTTLPLIDYSDIVDLIFDHDKVITW